MNDKREKFCREFLIDSNATAAYIRAGYSENGASQGGERLLRIVEVADRIKELQAEYREKHAITVENIVREMISDRQNARARGQYSVALKANVEICRIFGFFERDNRQKASPYETMSDDELREEAVRLAEKLEQESSKPH